MDQQNVCSSPHILNVLGILHTVSVCVLESQFPVQLDWIHKTWAQPTAGLCKTCLALLSLSEYLQIPTFPFWSFSSPKQKVSHSIMMPNFLHSKMHIHLFFFFLRIVSFIIFGCAGSSLMLKFSLVAENWATLLLWCVCFSLRWFWLLRNSGSRREEVNSYGSWAPEHKLSSCGTQAELLHGMWDLSESGVEPVSPALARGFFTTEPPEKPYFSHIYISETRMHLTFDARRKHCQCLHCSMSRENKGTSHEWWHLQLVKYYNKKKPLFIVSHGLFPLVITTPLG